MIIGQTGTLDISNFFGSNEPRREEIEEPREIPNRFPTFSQLFPN